MYNELEKRDVSNVNLLPSHNHMHFDLKMFCRRIIEGKTKPKKKSKSTLLQT